MSRCQRIESPAPEVQLWRIDLRGRASAQERWLLDDAEQARAARFAFEHLRDRYVLAHAALRQVLGTVLSREPATLRWRLGPQGKPYIDGEPALWFNLSHSNDVGLIALSQDRELGIDVEVLDAGRPRRDATALASSLFSPTEQQWMHAGGPEQIEPRFLRCWTRKEACIKAVGSGLSLAPQTFDAGPGDSQAQVSLHWQETNWPLWVMPVNAGADVVAALAHHTLSDSSR